MSTAVRMFERALYASQIRTYKHQMFSKCDQCVSFTHLRSLISDDNSAALKELANLKNAHLAYVSRARERMRERASFAREHPEDVLMVNVDGMDQAKTNIPNESLKDKGGCVGMPLCVRLMGAIAYGRGWYGFWSVPQWGATSNLTLTAIDYIIDDVLKEGKRHGLKGSHLPPPSCHPDGQHGQGQQEPQLAWLRRDVVVRGVLPGDRGTLPANRPHTPRDRPVVQFGVEGH